MVLLAQVLRLDGLIFLAMTFWMLACVAAGVGVGRYRCPACGKRFCSKRGLWEYKNNPFTRSCLNCGFPKNASEQGITQ